MGTVNRRYQSISLAWKVYGKGEVPVLAFHGFGQDSSIYEKFEGVINGRYRIYSFDLPYHGKSEPGKSSVPVTREALREFFTEFMIGECIDRFRVMAYSIGAKVGLNLVKIFPERIDGVILIAPDGLKINFWYNLATRNLVSRGIFKWVVYHPTAFFRIADILSAVKLVHASVTRFAESQMSTVQDRELVYFTWTGFRHLNLIIRELGDKINLYEVPVRVFLGERDRIIRPHHVKPLIRYITGTKIVLLPAGHNNLIESTAKYFRENGDF